MANDWAYLVWPPACSILCGGIVRVNILKHVSIQAVQLDPDIYGKCPSGAVCHRVQNNSAVQTLQTLARKSVHWAGHA